MQTPDFLNEFELSLARARRGIIVFTQMQKNDIEIPTIDTTSQTALKAQYKKFPKKLLHEIYEYDHFATIQPSHLAFILDYYRFKDHEKNPDYKPLIFSSHSGTTLQLLNLSKFIKDYFLDKPEIRKLDFFYESSHVMPVSMRRNENEIKIYYFEPSANQRNLSILRQAVTLLTTSLKFNCKLAGYAPDCLNLETIKRTSLQMSEYGCHSYALVMLRKISKLDSSELDKIFSSTEVNSYTQLPPEFARYTQSSTNLLSYIAERRIYNVLIRKSNTSLICFINENTRLELEKGYTDEGTIFTVTKRYNPLLPKVLKHFEIAAQVLEMASTPDEKISLLRKIREEYFVTYDQRSVVF